MKKFFALVLAAVMCFSLFSACADSQQPSEQQPSEQQPSEQQPSEQQPAEKTLAEKLKVDPDEKQTITVMSWHHTAQRRELMDKTIARFNEKYPNITIEHNPVEDYTQAYKLAFDSGDAPDIVYVDDTNQNLLWRHGYLMDIADIVEEMNWAEHAKPGELEYQNVRTPGEIYSVPYISGPRVVWYNKAIFDELKLEEPTTLEEFNALLAKVKEAGYIPFEASVRTLLWHIDGVLFGTTPLEDITKWYYLEESTPAYKEGRRAALDQVSEWVEKGYFRDGVTSIDHNNLNVLFGRGETAFYVAGASAAAPLHESGIEVGAFAFPRKSEDFPSVLVDASDSAWAIRADLPEEKLAATVAFIDQFFTKETTKDWVEGGFVTLMNFDVSDAQIPPQQMAALEATKDSQMGYFLDNAVPGLLNSMEILNARLLLGEIDGAGYDEAIDAEYEKLKAEELAKRN